MIVSVPVFTISSTATVELEGLSIKDTSRLALLALAVGLIVISRVVDGKIVGDGDIVAVREGRLVEDGVDEGKVEAVVAGVDEGKVEAVVVGVDDGFTITDEDAVMDDVNKGVADGVAEGQLKLVGDGEFPGVAVATDIVIVGVGVGESDWVGVGEGVTVDY